MGLTHWVGGKSARKALFEPPTIWVSMVSCRLSISGKLAGLQCLKSASGLLAVHKAAGETSEAVVASVSRNWGCGPAVGWEQ